jgi:hypothetical protein
VLVGVDFGIVRAGGGDPWPSARLEEWGAHLDLQEVLWRAIDLFEALLARVWHCLHGCGFLIARPGTVLLKVLLCFMLKSEASTVDLELYQRVV